MASPNTPDRSASSPELLDFQIEITEEDSRFLQEIRYRYPLSATAYLDWLTLCTTGPFRRPDSLEAPVSFDRPFELPGFEEK